MKPAHASSVATLRRVRRTALLVVLGAAVGGCALLGSHPLPKPPETVQAPPLPPPAPPLPAPTDTHKFVLASADDDVIGVVQVVTASKEDTLPDIARRFNVGYEEIVRANPGVDPWLPGAGRHIIVPTQFVLPAAPREGIVINVAALRLFYFPPHKKGEPQVVYTHPIGIGKVGWSTPEGVTRIISRVKDPTWRPSEDLREDHFKDTGEKLPAVVPAGPDNPLGQYEFILGWPSYRIHGTNKAYGIGLRSSHGCIRLYPEDIEKLFQMVPVGTKVRVVNQPFIFGRHDGQLYLQAYTVLEDDARDWTHAQKRLLSHELSPSLQKQLKAEGVAVNWQTVAAVTHAPRGLPVPVTSDGGIDAVLAAAPEVQNRVPDGANWDGIDRTGDDDKSAATVLSDREPSATAVATPVATPANAAPGG